MQRPGLIIGIIIAVVLIGGFGYIIYNGRPVVQMEKNAGTTQNTTPQLNENTTNTQPEVTVSTTTETPVQPPGTTTVQNPQPTQPTPPPTTPEPKPTAPPPTSDGGAKTYTLAQVQTHSTQDSCWAAINGSVYDLTTWIPRHPGGPQRIIGLCGKDGSAMFNQKHGSSSRAQAALVLLKIGTLAQ